jgi:hypothetical protein
VLVSEGSTAFDRAGTGSANPESMVEGSRHKVPSRSGPMGGSGAPTSHYRGSTESGASKRSVDFVQVLATVLGAPPVEHSGPRIRLDQRVAHRGYPLIDRLRD